MHFHRVTISPLQNTAGADDFLPVLIYVLIHANPPQLASNLMYIERFRMHSRMMSESAYFFTQLVGCRAGSPDGAVSNMYHSSSSSMLSDFDSCTFPCTTIRTGSGPMITWA